MLLASTSSSHPLCIPVCLSVPICKCLTPSPSAPPSSLSFPLFPFLPCPQLRHSRSERALFRLPASERNWRKPQWPGSLLGVPTCECISLTRLNCNPSRLPGSIWDYLWHRQRSLCLLWLGEQGGNLGHETTPFNMTMGAKLWLKNIDIAGCKTARSSRRPSAASRSHCLLSRQKCVGDGCYL